MKKLSILILILFSTNLFSQKNQDIDAIKNMCGCFEVEFKFAETFNYSNDPSYVGSKNYKAKALELALLIKDEKNHLSIQHILVTEKSIIKHWRQDWIYQNTDLYSYSTNNRWEYREHDKKNVKNQWTQKVYQVDDSPRYEGSSRWVHFDDKSYWENITDAPLPRREYTKRDDYNLMQRGNRHEIVDDGWIHEQDNLKIIRNNTDFVLAEEKGYNYYKKVSDSKCKEAVDWWNQNEEKWALVRKKWEDIYSKNKDISLKKLINNKPLFSYLFNKEIKKETEITSIIDDFVKK